jgi:hypothetical protein
MSTRVPVAKAQFTPQTGSDKTPLVVHFNPVSLQYSVSNTIKDEGNDKKPKQYVTQGTGKLTMDLIFDNTADGNDVRAATSKVAALMEPDPQSSGAKKQSPTIVLFEWGYYKFQGMLESYKETLDFFSPSGVPLRAGVNVTLVEQKLSQADRDKLFTLGLADTAGDLTLDTVTVPTGQFDPASAASAGGNPSAARAIGALNGEASLRFSAGASLTVTGSITLAPPVAFATGGAGISLGAGAGIGIGASAGAGFGLGVGAGASFGASAGVSVGASGGALFGASASAGVTAGEGAFSGLRMSAAPATVSVDTRSFLTVTESVSVSMSAADFAVGGQAVATAAGGLAVDVGANADLRARIQFEVE